jgi:hypothetical protein
MILSPVIHQGFTLSPLLICITTLIIARKSLSEKGKRFEHLPCTGIRFAGDQIDTEAAINLLAASISSCYNPSLQLGKSRNSCK